MLQQLKLPMIVLAFAGLGAGAVTTYRVTTPDPRGLTCRPGATALARLELLFGMGKKDGGEVSDEEWRAFLDTEVSPALSRWADGADRRRAMAQQPRRSRQGDIAHRR